MAKKPTGAQVIAYDVGFGDCFLLRFHYPDRDRHVLIDFGAHPTPKWGGADFRLRVARAIAEDCGEAGLDAVVATHRHADHVNGFATGTEGKEDSGDVIRALKPKVVVQPWTEHPDADREATAAPDFARSDESARGVRAYVGALADMETVATFALREAAAIREKKKGSRIARELAFLGGENIRNASAVRNLMTMATGKRGQRYVHFGSRSGLERILPGVKVHVLGPPTLEQSRSIQEQRQKDGREFWHLRAAFWATAARIAAGAAPEPEVAAQGVPGEEAPPYARWLVRKLKESRGRELLEIVRRLDDALNNTSVILLFKAGGRKLLFPGDAQFENWMYALGQPKVAALLKDVDFYKVGHHGSLNATPRTSLWNAFTRRSTDEGDPDRLITLVSTESGHHGHAERNTEVPRKKLMTALKTESDCRSTEEVFSRERKERRERGAPPPPIRRLTIDLPFR